MGEKKDYTITIGGQEIKAISESDLTFSYEQKTFERDCEVHTTHGIIHFKAVFTEKEWSEFLEISKKAGKWLNE